MSPWTLESEPVLQGLNWESLRKPESWLQLAYNVDCESRDCLLRSSSSIGTSSADNGRRDLDWESLGQVERFGLLKSGI